MNTRTRYPLAKKAVQLCSVLKISHERVFRRAGLSPDFDKHENGGVSALILLHKHNEILMIQTVAFYIEQKVL